MNLYKTFSFFYQKKYIKPFIYQISILDKSSCVFLSQFFEHKFLIILCIDKKIYEIEYKEKQLFFSTLNIEATELLQWNDFSSKIIHLKTYGENIKAEHLILVISEKIREIVSMYQLSFQQSQDILHFLISSHSYFFQNNHIEIPESDINGKTLYWVD